MRYDGKLHYFAAGVGLLSEGIDLRIKETKVARISNNYLVIWLAFR